MLLKALTQNFFAFTFHIGEINRNEEPHVFGLRALPLNLNIRHIE